MMERRQTPRKDWVVGRDDIGHSVQEWKIDNLRTLGPERDPCARTCDFLARLEVAELELEDDSKSSRSQHGLNPYDSGRFQRQKFER